MVDVDDQDAFEAGAVEVVLDAVVVPLVCDDDLLKLDVDVVVKVVVVVSCCCECCPPLSSAPL